jgi:ATP-dependent protease Clp ATPase subunit
LLKAIALQYLAITVLNFNSSEGSILRQYKESFEGYGIEFNITPEAVNKIAEQAIKEKTGARGLMTVLERILRDFKFELPSSGIRHFELDTNTIDNPTERLTKMLLDNADLVRENIVSELKNFATRFAEETGFKLKFAQDAQDALAEKSIEQDKSVSAICYTLFKDYKHGLAIVSRNTNKKTWTLTRKAIENPDKFLSDLVVKSFNK